MREGYCSCLSACEYLSVPALAASASVETSNQRYSQVSLRILIRGFLFCCRGGGVKGRGFAKNTRIRIHYYEVLTADQRSSFFPL